LTVPPHPSGIPWPVRGLPQLSAHPSGTQTHLLPLPDTFNVHVFVGPQDPPPGAVAMPGIGYCWQGLQLAFPPQPSGIVPHTPPGGTPPPPAGPGQVAAVQHMP
jgi:hypothetical protein